MPILEWLNKNEAINTASKVPYRILKANKELSYGENNENMIIKGDNLEALKALLPYYKGQVKCIYIDPPYNTGNAFEHYDDNLEHSKWLSLMYPRMELLRELLAEDGAFCMQLDDEEVHYAKVFCDEIFGRKNFIATIAIKSSTPSGVKTAHRAKKIIKQKDMILIYKKSDKLIISPQYVKKDSWDAHYCLFLANDKNENLYFENLIDILLTNKIIEERVSVKNLNVNNKKFKKFYSDNRDKICRLQSHKNDKAKEISCKNPNIIVEVESKDGKTTNLYYNGQVVTPLSSGFSKVVYNREVSDDLGMLLCDFWQDIDFQNTQNEGNVDFPTSKKPEALIFRILSLFSNEGDLVLDSFLGSGTTCAVAQKMGRKYIGIEMGEHAITHCVPRMKAVIDGEQGGISKTLNWQGGGGYIFYDLGETVFDEDGNINKNVDFKTLASHIWFSETKTPLLDFEKSPLLGVYNGTAYYLLYNGILGDKKPDGGNVLTQKVFDTLPKFDGKKVIYGEATRMNEEKRKINNITFKQTPYDIKAR